MGGEPRREDERGSERERGGKRGHRSLLRGWIVRAGNREGELGKRTVEDAASPAGRCAAQRLRKTGFRRPRWGAALRRSSRDGPVSALRRDRPGTGSSCTSTGCGRRRRGRRLRDPRESGLTVRVAPPVPYALHLGAGDASYHERRVVLLCRVGRRVRGFREAPRGRYGVA